MPARASVLRQWRRRAHQKQSGLPTRPTVAVLTVARDEAAMLPRWVAHYGSHVGVENLVVVDDNTSDGSTDDLP